MIVILKIGDVVELNQVGLDNRALVPSNMVKRKEIPNIFHVTKVKKPNKDCVDIVYISLAECCGRDESHCFAHPSEYFSLKGKD